MKTNWQKNIKTKQNMVSPEYEKGLTKRRATEADIFEKGAAKPVATEPQTQQTKPPSSSSVRVTGRYGEKRGDSEHGGIDLSGNIGDPIYVTGDGVVSRVAKDPKSGNYVVVDHGNGIQTFYLHIKDGGVLVSAGDKVEKGQKIAEVGATGHVSGPHLHYEVRKNNVRIDPNTSIPSLSSPISSRDNKVSMIDRPDTKLASMSVNNNDMKKEMVQNQMQSVSSPVYAINKNNVIVNKAPDTVLVSQNYGRQNTDNPAILMA